MKSPFVGYSLEEIANAESSAYVIQVGSDMFHYNGTYTFSRRSAVYYRNKILANLLDSIANGTEDEKNNAHRVVMWLRILPLRIH